MPIEDSAVLARIEALKEPRGEAVRVRVESVEDGTALPGGLIVLPDHQLVDLKVVVASVQKDPFPLVSPKRFCLRFSRKGSRDSRKLDPVLSAIKQPPLPTQYLKPGEEAQGWLRFLLPQDAENITLRSDLETPEIAIPILVPAPKRERGAAR